MDRLQTLGTCVVLVAAFVICWAVKYPPARRDDIWIPLSLCTTTVAAAVVRGLYSMDVVMCDERTYVRRAKAPVSEQI
jgi:hypothetical protein